MGSATYLGILQTGIFAENPKGKPRRGGAARDVLHGAGWGNDRLEGFFKRNRTEEKLVLD